MNRTIRIISIIGILLACTMLVAFKSQETNVKYIRTNYVSGTHGNTYVIESLEELEEYYNANKEKHNLGHREKVYSDTTIGFVDATKEYDEEFFKNQRLGIGTELSQFVLSKYPNEKYHYQVAHSNKASIGLATSLGFKFTGVRELVIKG